MWTCISPMIYTYVNFLCCINCCQNLQMQRCQKLIDTLECNWGEAGRQWCLTNTTAPWPCEVVLRKSECGKNCDVGRCHFSKLLNFSPGCAVWRPPTEELYATYWVCWGCGVGETQQSQVAGREVVLYRYRASLLTHSSSQMWVSVPESNMFCQTSLLKTHNQKNRKIRKQENVFSLCNWCVS